MRDAIVMWRSTKLAVLSALCAAFYAALLIPFKAIPLIPGLTELRPGNVVPVVAGVLFGPAAAWGCAVGNLIGDFFGTIGPGSFFGFIGNFLYAYVPYRLWRLIMRGQPATGAPGQAPVFLIVAVLGGMACAVVIGWGVDMLGLVPYQVLTAVITLNNSAASILLGLLLLPLVYPRARRWGLLYEDLMRPEDYCEGPLAPVGALLVVVGAVGGAALALVMFLGGDQGPLAAMAESGVTVKGLGLLSAAMVLVGSCLFTRIGRRGEEGGVAEAEDLAQTPQTGPAIQVEGLHFAYPLSDAPALQDVNISQERGQLRVLMGATGAGKSTLCKCLNGVIPELQTGDFGGTVRIFGRDIRGLPVYALAPLVGQVFQDFESQLLTTSVELEVAFPLENMGTPVDEMTRRVQQALESVEMWGLRDREPHVLSGGEKQRLALAAALVNEPPILVLDEPTTDLDPQGKRELLDQCRRLRDEGRTLVIAEHETDLALGADLLTVLQAGRVAFDGSPQELLSDPARSEALGLRPLDIPRLFAELDRPERPLTVDEAAELLQLETCDQERWEEIATPWMAEAYRANNGSLDRPVLSVQGLQHVYAGGVEAIRNVSFDVHAGEFVAILGENGSGKTTLAKHLNGLLKPTQGRVLVGGRDTKGLTPAGLAQTVGYLFQDPDHQIFADTVWEEVAFGPRNVGLEPDVVERRVSGALETVGLVDQAADDPFLLTKGERQLVALASVLALKPQVIVFDEPTTGLDGPRQRQMMEALRALNAKGHTIIVITHCNWAAAEYAHRAIVMQGGELLADAPVRDVFGDSALLARSGQSPPLITELAMRVWGRPMLSVDEAVYCLRAGDTE
ncbi:MAG: ATP-binding cassette domain-containing protein [Armatimonadetes bacterium]|nr:ATP-binding cassette domain-containing protein [Armatimonadota bacterium]MDI9585978.1 energy-coupling factor transporter ATPase [Acidobacteriota bacterium]